jgi:hypothetical protein
MLISKIQETVILMRSRRQGSDKAARKLYMGKNGLPRRDNAAWVKSAMTEWRTFLMNLLSGGSE